MPATAPAGRGRPGSIPPGGAAPPPLLLPRRSWRGGCSRLLGSRLSCRSTSWPSASHALAYSCAVRQNHSVCVGEGLRAPQQTSLPGQPLHPPPRLHRADQSASTSCPSLPEPSIQHLTTQRSQQKTSAHLQPTLHTPLVHSQSPRLLTHPHIPAPSSPCPLPTWNSAS